jgi:hypothetical protein
MEWAKKPSHAAFLSVGRIRLNARGITKRDQSSFILCLQGASSDEGLWIWCQTAFLAVRERLNSEQ